MKRLSGKTRHGGFVVVPKRLPPHTTDTNPHNDGVNIGCRANAAACAQLTATTAANGGPVGQQAGTIPPSSTVRAANPDHHTGARARKRRHQPRTVVNGTPNRRDIAPIEMPPAISLIASPIASTGS
jgi:hypothetical protein